MDRGTPHKTSRDRTCAWTIVSGIPETTRRQILKYVAAAAASSWLPGTLAAAQGRSSLLELAHELRGQWGEITDASFSPDGELLAFGCFDLQGDFAIRTFRLSDGEPAELGVIPHQGWVTRIAFHPGGEMIVVGDGRGALTPYSLSGEPVLEPLAVSGEAVDDISFSPDGDLIAAASGGSAVEIWELAAGIRLAPPITGSEGAEVVSAAFHPEGQDLAVGHADGIVRLISVPSMLPNGGEVRGHFDSLKRLAYSGDGRRLAAFGGGAITVWDSDTLNTLFGGGTGLAPINCGALSPDGKWIAYGYGGGEVVLAEIKQSDGRKEKFDAQDGSYVSSVAFSPDGALFATAGGAGKVSIWALAT